MAQRYTKERFIYGIKFSLLVKMTNITTKIMKSLKEFLYIA